MGSTKASYNAYWFATPFIFPVNVRNIFCICMIYPNKATTNKVMMSVQKAGVLCLWRGHQMFQWRYNSKTFFQETLEDCNWKIKMPVF